MKMSDQADVFDLMNNINPIVYHDFTSEKS